MEQEDPSASLLAVAPPVADSQMVKQEVQVNIVVLWIAKLLFRHVGTH